MPIFEYICQECDHHFETIVNGSTRVECPACHGEKLAKQLSVFAVSSKGASPALRPMAGPCGTCGDPRGPGSCSLN